MLIKIDNVPRCCKVSEFSSCVCNIGTKGCEVRHRFEVGDRVTFFGDLQPFKVQAAGTRFVVLTRPYNPKRTTTYTIMDLEEWVRGTENLVFSMGFETREQCEEALARLESRDEEIRTEISRRNRVAIVITQHNKAK
jgi:hypothetical protein